MEACILKTPRKGPQLLTLVLRMRNQIPRLFADINVYSQYQHARTYLFGSSFDYCDYTSASNEPLRNPVAKLVYALAVQKFPQALLKCPVSGLVNITDMMIDSDFVPPIMPTGRYRTTLRMYNKRNQTLLAWICDSIVS
uniref:Uncharacterized protein n=1 Tax=Anopheles epiroticus TaxID=199890 RepID=A0A182PD46_9DIPT